MIKHYQAQMQVLGIRRLLVLSGSQQWCYCQLEHLTRQVAGDWLCLSDNSSYFPQAIPFHKATGLLGQEFKHAAFDATCGFNLDAFAILSGALAAGSFYVLMVPTWQHWPNAIDVDSLRWNETNLPIATPHFIRFVQQHLINDPTVLLWQEGSELQGDLVTDFPHWVGIGKQAKYEQDYLLSCLLDTTTAKTYILTAPRGRGKSTIAGKLIGSWSGRCLLTAPNKSAVKIVEKWAGNNIEFIAPDRLVLLDEQKALPQADWLIIDEAAAIPIPLLEKLMFLYPRILLITTVLGYEGTGRGFLLKLCEKLNNYRSLTLTYPIRWAANDPLEKTVNQLLLMDVEQQPLLSVSGRLHLCIITHKAFDTSLMLLQQFFALLMMAHYRTSPIDLRRLLDASGMHYLLLLDKQQRLAAGVWGIDEGGLSPDLVDKIWAGIRRPRGNLLVQSLAAHAGQSLAAELHSIRISRIAVIPHLRRNGLAYRLIEHLGHQAKLQKKDFLSVSFGYTKELNNFWHYCGFHLVHIGSQKEASSGCYSAMALKPLTEKGGQILAQCRNRLQKDWVWLNNRIKINLPINIIDDQQLDVNDWRELAGFAFAFRPIEAAYAALCRLLKSSEISSQAIALTGYLFEQLSAEYLIEVLALSGKKALIKCWRTEAALLMKSLDVTLFNYWDKKVKNLLSS